VVNYSALISINTIWSQSQSPDNNPQKIASDVGEIIYRHPYESGVPASGINEIYYDINVLESGDSKTYDLLDLTGEILGHTTLQDFDYVKSLTIKNLSEEFSLDIDASVSDSFDTIFGEPSQKITLNPLSMIHINTTGLNFPVETGEQYITFENNGTGECEYELVIMGNSS